MSKILVAMSGGVDSSVAALLLQQEGFEAIGIFMNFWSENKDDLNKCCSAESARLARSVAKKLKIKLYSLNCKEVFRQKVVSNYLKGYEMTKTPNPCVICNREIKFKRLLKVARDLKAEKIATGHYAQVIKRGNKFELHRGIDKKKDQSYFLWGLPYSSLASIRFPIGGLKKNQVRAIAKKYGLITHNKKDSQGLCFVGRSNAEFISKYAQKLLEPGNVADADGRIIGRHKGLAFYTIGQRTGFEVAGDKWRKNRIDLSPLYVSGFDLEKNQLIVDESSKIFSDQIQLEETNWLDEIMMEKAQKKTVDLLAQIRYQHKADPCQIRIKGKYTAVKFRRPQRAITPGQSCVFYQKNRLIGGGIIKK